MSQRVRRIVFWFLPVMILAGAALYLRLRWDAIPERFPIHWGWRGTPDDWATRAPLAVGMPLIVAGILDFIILGASAFFSRRARRSLAAVENGQAESAGRELQGLAVAIASFVALMGSMIAMTMPFAESSRRVIGVVVLCSLLGALAMMVFLFLLVVKVDDAMNAARRQALADGTLSPEVDKARRDRRYWKWGVFYYNPDDPALWVEKLYGAGWTTNMARRASWWLLGGSVVFVLAVVGFVVWRAVM